jgi:hypothetical protein
MTTRTKRLCLCLGVALVLSLVVFAVPFTREAVMGWARGEAFFRGQPTSSWLKLVRHYITTGVPPRTRSPAWLGDRPDVLPLLNPAHADAAVPVLVELLRSKDSDIRREAAAALGWAATRREQAIRALIAALEDDNRQVRGFAASSLLVGPRNGLFPALLDPIRPADVPVLLDLVRCPYSEYARMEAAHTLARATAHREQAVAALVAALRDESEKVREAAAHSLPHLDPQAADRAGVPLIQLDDDQVLCWHPTGGLAWSVPWMPPFSKFRAPPMLQWDTNRVYVASGGGVMALDRATGELLWQAEGPRDCLLLSGDLLLATGPDVVARATADGREVFRVPLPGRGWGYRVQEVAGLFAVQTYGLQGEALLLDRKGRLCYRLDGPDLAGLRQGEDSVFLTTWELVRVSAEGERRWSIAVTPHERPLGGELRALPGGELLAVAYYDGGIQAVRFDPATGKAAWQAWCTGKVTPYAGKEHRAKVVVKDGRVRVTAGTSVEVLDLETGRRLKP